MRKVGSGCEKHRKLFFTSLKTKLINIPIESMYFYIKDKMTELGTVEIQGALLATLLTLGHSVAQQTHIEMPFATGKDDLKGKISNVTSSTKSV